MNLNSVFAQELQIGEDGPTIQGPLKGPGGTDIDSLGSVISIILPVVIVTAGIILFFVLVTGGITIMTSAGNPEKLKKAGAQITSSLVGFVLLALSYVLIKFVTRIFGLGIDLF